MVNVTLIIMLLLLLSRFSPTLCDSIDGSPPSSAIPGILQARTLDVGCYFLLQCMKVKSESESLSCVRLFATPWTAAYQASPSMGFSRQEYWSGLPLPSPLNNYSTLSNIKRQYALGDLVFEF